VLSPGQRLETILGVIRAARRRLAFSLFRCDEYQILDELAAALERGIQIEVLITPRAKGWGKRLKNLWIYLESMGAKMHRYGGAGKYHAKYILSDDGPALIASLNFTKRCLAKTNDFLVVTHDPAVVTGLRALFEADCRAPESSMPEGLTERLVVGPDQARQRIGDMIRQAQRRIRIVDHKVTDPEMLAALDARLDAGVQIELLGSGAFRKLRSHGKLLLIDDKLAMMGSISLSRPGLNDRREVAILVDDPAIIHQLGDHFQTLAKAPVSAMDAGEDEDEDDEEEESEED